MYDWLLKLITVLYHVRLTYQVRQKFLRLLMSNSRAFAGYTIVIFSFDFLQHMFLLSGTVSVHQCKLRLKTVWHPSIISGTFRASTLWNPVTSTFDLMTLKWHHELHLLKTKSVTNLNILCKPHTDGSQCVDLLTLEPWHDKVSNIKLGMWQHWVSSDENLFPPNLRFKPNYFMTPTFVTYLSTQCLERDNVP